MAGKTSLHMRRSVVAVTLSGKHYIFQLVSWTVNSSHDSSQTYVGVSTHAKCSFSPVLVRTSSTPLSASTISTSIERAADSCVISQPGHSAPAANPFFLSSCSMDLWTVTALCNCTSGGDTEWSTLLVHLELIA